MVVGADKCQLFTRRPSELNPAELDGFVALVELGGEVAPGLRERIAGSLGVVLVLSEGTIIGTAALKRPVRAYRDDVFRKAGVPDAAGSFALELGWVFIAEPFRGNGLAGRAVVSALDLAEGRSVFATTRETNAPMQRLLVSHSFGVTGHSYDSQQHQGQKLRLLARPAKG